jgi:RNA polymerase sigma factor (sigma-70 family)
MNKDATVFLEALIHMDSKKIKEIYKNNYPNVKRFVLQNKGQATDAEDVFQKALLQITVRYKKEKFDINSSFEGYLYTVCKNLWRRELNNSKNWVTNNTVVELYSEERDNSFAIIEQKRQELFIEKLGMISDNCKKILTLFFAKVPYMEIVEQSDYTSEKAVRQRVFKCKKKLTELVQGDNRYNSLKEL